jgi:hypothetical protein
MIRQPAELVAEHDGEHERGQVYAGGLGQDAAEGKEGRSDAADVSAELVTHVVVRAVDFAFVVGGDEDIADDDTGEQVADEAELQVGEVAAGIEDDVGHADEGNGADFGGDDGAADGVPGELAAAEEEIADGGLAAGQGGAEPGGQGEVAEDDRPVDPGEAGAEAGQQVAAHPVFAARMSATWPWWSASSRSAVGRSTLRACMTRAVLTCPPA